MLTVEAAQALALAAVRRVGAERVPLALAHGRILRESVRARFDLPSHDNSAMDGYAVRGAVAGGSAGPATLELIGESAAGHPSELEVGPGQAMKIMTGALLPPGADAVIMVEETSPHGHQVQLTRLPRVGEHVRKRGEDVQAGDVVLREGMRLGPGEVGLLASLRRTQVAVSRPPEVAVLSTGDELRDPDDDWTPEAIYDSNSHALAALVREAGGRPRLLPIARDDRAALRAALEEARTADVVITSGGVSVGEHDHVRAVLESLGAQLDFWRVAMKPGKPVALARLGDVALFGLPGNPVSSMVAFLLFVRPALRAALGCREPLDLPEVDARLGAPLKIKGERRHYLRARLGFDGGALLATPMARQGSAALTSVVGASGLIVVPEGGADLPQGAAVRVLLIGPLLG